MKKITLIALGLIMSVCVFGQQTMVLKNAKKSDNLQGKFVQHSNADRASVLVQDFETWPPVDWTIVNGDQSQGTQQWNQFDSEVDGFNNVARVLYDDGDGVARPQDEWMISPAFTVPEGGLLRFYLNTSRYWFIDPNDNADINVLISTDDGATWTELIDEAGVEGLETYTWKAVVVDLVDYIGDEAKIAFQYLGTDAAQCSIDNVEVFSRPDYDVQLEDICVNFDYVDNDPSYHDGGTYHQSGHFSRIPKKMLDENNTIMLFNAIVYNFGSNEAAVNCEVKILDPDDEVVYTESVVSGTLAQEDIDTLDIGFTDETLFSLDTYKYGDYKIIYNLTIEGQTDEDMHNNTDTVILESTENVYSRALGRNINGVTGPTYWSSSAPGDKMLIDYNFKFPAEMEVGDLVEITSIDAFISDESTAGHVFNAEVSYYDGQDLVTLGGTAPYVLEESQLESMVTMTFADPVYVPKNDNNFVQVRVAIQVSDASDASSPEYILFGTEALPTEGTSTLWDFESNSSVIYISNFLDEIPVVNLNLDFPGAVSENGFTNFNLYPNPTADFITVENVENARIEVYNLIGEKVASVENAEFRTKIDMSDLSNGTYVVRVVSDKGIGLRKVNLVK